MKARAAIAVSVSFVLPSVTVLRAAANPAGAPPRPLSVLAAGDSFTSGHGVPGSTFDPCHTAMTAWPFRAVQDTGLPIEAGGITFKACSGARTTDFASQWDGHTKYDLVMFTFGGDDLDFGGVMLQCLNLDPHFYLHLGCPADTTERALIAAMRGSYFTLLDKVLQATKPGGNVLVMGYPEIFAKTSISSWPICNGIWWEDANRIRGWAADLNATIGQAVKDFGAGHPSVHFSFLNVDDQAVTPGDAQYLWEPPGATTTHTLCGTSTPWLNGLNLGDFSTTYKISYHPNQIGLDAEGHLAARAITRMSWSEPLATQGPPTQIQPVPPPSVTLAQGPAAPAGYRYAVSLREFAASTPISVTCYDSVSAGGFYTFPLNTDGSGNASTAGQCYSSDGPDHWVVAGGIASNHVQWNSTLPPAGPPPPPPPPPAPPPPAAHPETTGGIAHSWSNYTNAGGTEGPSIPKNARIQVTCKITGFRVSDGNTWWYQIASAPWNNAYYVSADAFYNNGQTSGSLVGTPFLDANVSDC